MTQPFCIDAFCTYLIEPFWDVFFSLEVGEAGEVSDMQTNLFPSIFS